MSNKMSTCEVREEMHKEVQEKIDRLENEFIAFKENTSGEPHLVTIATLQVLMKHVARIEAKLNRMSKV